jgi:hypothetical protein
MIKQVLPLLEIETMINHTSTFYFSKVLTALFLVAFVNVYSQDIKGKWKVTGISFEDKFYRIDTSMDKGVFGEYLADMKQKPGKENGLTRADTIGYAMLYGMITGLFGRTTVEFDGDGHMVLEIPEKVGSEKPTAFKGTYKLKGEKLTTSFSDLGAKNLRLVSVTPLS